MSGRERGAGGLRELTERLCTQEPEEIRRLRTGTLAHRAGSYGQYFTTWDLANGILRDYSMNLYQWLRIAADETLPAGHVLTMLRTADPIYSTYLGYSGFETLAHGAERLLRRDDHDRASLLAGLSELTGYVNRLTAWSHHQFPWHLGGEQYRYPQDGAVVPPCAYTPTPGSVTPEGRPERRVRVRLRWEPYGLEAVGELATDLNEELCREFLAALPFTVLQDHAVVSGRTMYAWTPLVSLAPTPVTERICDAPDGRLRYSMATGNKLVVQYGPANEPLRVPVLGQVVPEDLGVLEKVGALVWESTFRSKEPVWLTVRPG
jgi:hypothetical protein